MQNCKSCDDLFNKLFELVHKFLNMEAKFATKKMILSLGI